MGEIIDAGKEIVDSAFNAVVDKAGWVTDAIRGYLGFNKGAPTVVGGVDVVKNYKWSVNTPHQSYLREVPRIILTEYQANTSPAMDDIRYTAGLAASAGKALVGANSVSDDVSPYINMYKGTRTGNQYTLPFFSDYNHVCTNVWSAPEPGKGGLASAMTEIKEGIQKVSSMLSPSVIEKRLVWGGVEPAGFTFRFNLYNTLTTNDEILKNFILMRALVHNNLPDKTSSSTMLPPCFYAIDVVGVRSVPACAISVTVTNMGQLNTKILEIPTSGGESKPSPIVVPDAWSITIAVQELLKETRQIYIGAFDDAKKVVVITSEDEDEADVGVAGTETA